MDIRDLKFQNDYFEKVLYIHVMDFINEYEDATSELIRVWKPNREFVIKYPTEEENAKLTTNLIKDSFRKSIPGKRIYKGTYVPLYKYCLAEHIIRFCFD